MSRDQAFSPDFATYFLKKCRSIIKSTAGGDIWIGGFVTIIGQGLGLRFENLPYVEIEGPRFIDIDALVRMNMLIDRGDGTYGWLNDKKIPVFLLPSVAIGAFDPFSPQTWDPSTSLNADGDIISEDEDEAMPDQGEPQFQPN
ncbi:hypothetical protein LXL04_007118 [Taraxacum kok-saghyz]